MINEGAFECVATAKDAHVCSHFFPLSHTHRTPRPPHTTWHDFLPSQDKLPAGQKPKYTGVISGITYTVRTTGFFSLYRGLAPTLVGSMPKAGIRFGANSELKKVRVHGVLFVQERISVRVSTEYVSHFCVGSRSQALATCPPRILK